MDDGLSRSDFELVEFALTPEEQAQQEELSRSGWCGQASNHVWFCLEHAPAAEALSHLHWREAMDKLRPPRTTGQNDEALPAPRQDEEATPVAEPGHAGRQRTRRFFSMRRRTPRG
ncbi:hypothetical protein [Actinomadura verrucosospora]|uniref:hypothetical protein n=1 Tax=Actinomadura verrucosospora TaxID=46165 RepID=UPI001564258C|nr:hypothetical protein [Actinomadura verrucosospora]